MVGFDLHFMKFNVKFHIIHIIKQCYILTLLNTLIKFIMCLCVANKQTCMLIAMWKHYVNE
jgi:hypothetical protein